MEVSQKQRIDPERINDTEYRMDIQAQLVSAIEPSELKLGKFTASVTITVTYE
ncbi:fimbrial subunit [Providencia burhodogranariea]|uniref:Fimbrial subunit n=1 Tax=Providencia burhodogranariea DSM 19968 TaxID=1141662 RepID=K8WT37_9GAMM|nr:fimbrial subunit [Providencia burhodogranariea]EKT63804.1 fimbrial subunit [Providencia burhodogranariea DSM 19968]